MACRRPLTPSAGNALRHSKQLLLMSSKRGSLLRGRSRSVVLYIIPSRAANSATACLGTSVTHSFSRRATSSQPSDVLTALLRHGQYAMGVGAAGNATLEQWYSVIICLFCCLLRRERRSRDRARPSLSTTLDRGRRDACVYRIVQSVVHAHVHVPDPVTSRLA